MTNEQQEHARTLYNTTKAKLWRDECGTPFILTKCAELYIYGADRIGAYWWSVKQFNNHRGKHKPLEAYTTGDGMVFAVYPLSALAGLAAIQPFKRRPHRHGCFISTTRSKLGHELYPCKPMFVKPTSISRKQRLHITRKLNRTTLQEPLE